MILRNKKLIGIISAFITANMLLVGCGSAESSSMVDDRDEKIVYANYRDIRDLNPHLYNGEMFAQNLLYESSKLNNALFIGVLSISCKNGYSYFKKLV